MLPIVSLGGVFLEISSSWLLCMHTLWCLVRITLLDKNSLPARHPRFAAYWAKVVFEKDRESSSITYSYSYVGTGETRTIPIIQCRVIYPPTYCPPQHEDGIHRNRTLVLQVDTSSAAMFLGKSCARNGMPSFHGILVGWNTIDTFSRMPYGYQ